MTALVSTGNLSPTLTLFFSSAAAVVMTLNVDPGGWGAEKATPASARTSPVRGSSAAIPPSRPASASTAASCRRLSIVDRTRRAGRALARASTVRPASRVPPGQALHLTLQRALEAGRAHRACRAGSRVRRPRPARHGRRWARRCRRSRRRRPSGEVRASAGPSASTLPSRETIVARGGRLGCGGVSRSPSRQSGERQLGRPGHAVRRPRAAPTWPRMLAEDAGGHHDRDPQAAAAGAAWLAHPGGGGGGRSGRAARRRARKAAGGYAPLRLLVQQRVHRAVVLAVPGGGELLRGALGVRVAGPSRRPARCPSRRRPRPPARGPRGGSGAYGARSESAGRPPGLQATVQPP